MEITFYTGLAAKCYQTERHQVQKGLFDTALQVTTIASMIVVTLCVAAFGLFKLHRPEGRIASANPSSVLHDDSIRNTSSNLPGSGSRTVRPAVLNPLSEHLERLGNRLDELVASKITRERSTQSEIALLADSMHAVQHQADLSGTRLQAAVGNLRVSSEVQLRDLNRQVNGVSENSQRLEREMLEHRAGILSAREPARCRRAARSGAIPGDR